MFASMHAYYCLVGISIQIAKMFCVTVTSRKKNECNNNSNFSCSRKIKKHKKKRKTKRSIKCVYVCVREIDMLCKRNNAHMHSYI